VDHAFVLYERTVWWRRSAFGVDALNCGVELSKSVATIDERDLRKQQNEEQAEND
jgi:hypothetical protein